jgi:hypothetical protein
MSVEIQKLDDEFYHGVLSLLDATLSAKQFGK